jgi:hypothetical protein
MPMAAEIPNPERFCSAASRLATRRRHQLPSDAVLFGFGFDLKSTAIRKNPMGSLEAFQQAFPPRSGGLSERVALMIKTFPPQRFSAEWHWLQARAAEDQRIHLVVDSLDRDDLLALYGCCDVFLSLHRSEGFGRGMAEALQLGLDVIATDYSGNTDFCTGPLAHPVRWRPAPIPRGAYPCADGHSWAEPDLDHAVLLMREVAAQRLAPGPQHRTTYHERFSFAATGARYRERLDTLWQHRQQLCCRPRAKAIPMDKLHQTPHCPDSSGSRPIRRCGPGGGQGDPPPAQLPLDQLEALAEALLDFSGPADPPAWLAEHSG